jgi:thymidine kinase
MEYVANHIYQTIIIDDACYLRQNISRQMLKSASYGALFYCSQKKKKFQKNLDRIDLLLIFIILNNLNIKSYERKN